MAYVSAEAWGRPDRRLRTIGITGTKGKSTVSYMLRHILDRGVPGSRAAVTGSIRTYDGVSDEESLNTTPEAPDLWRHLSNAADAGLAYADMEISSQALKYDRTLGLPLDVACFLNIGRDHISPVEHPDFEDYFESKLRIFDQSDVAVVNLDSDMPERILERAGGCRRAMTLSVGNAADYTASDVESHDGAISFTAHAPSWSARVELGMPGLFNVSNALAAIAVADILGAAEADIVSGLAEARVPGRMELLRTDSGVTGIVDYAHNGMSYRSFFPSIREEFPDSRVVSLFGAPGGKAQERRRELPAEASKWSDRIIYTEEDPATEDVAGICAEMAANTPEGQPYEIVCDRTEAIRRAVDWAYENESAIVCLLAKGDELTQHEASGFVPMTPDGDVFHECVREHGHEVL